MSNQLTNFQTSLSVLLAGVSDERKPVIQKRLETIAKAGMHEIGYGEFGFPRTSSGLYIEMIWHFSDLDFQDYMTWAIETNTNSLIQN